jgi:UrcA family protein
LFAPRPRILPRILSLGTSVLDRFPNRQEIRMSRVAGIWINATVALVAGAWLSDAAAAAPVPVAGADVQTTTVHFADLNLDQPAGVASLYRRITVAADRVCGEPYLTGSHVVSDGWRVCVTQAVDRAVLVLDRPTLSAYHRAHMLPAYTGTTITQALAAKP